MALPIWANNDTEARAVFTAFSDRIADVRTLKAPTHKQIDDLRRALVFAEARMTAIHADAARMQRDPYLQSLYSDLHPRFERALKRLDELAATAPADPRLERIIARCQLALTQLADLPPPDRMTSAQSLLFVKISETRAADQSWVDAQSVAVRATPPALAAQVLLTELAIAIQTKEFSHVVANAGVVRAAANVMLAEAQAPTFALTEMGVKAAIDAHAALVTGRFNPVIKSFTDFPESKRATPAGVDARAALTSAREAVDAAWAAIAARRAQLSAVNKQHIDGYNDLVARANAITEFMRAQRAAIATHTTVQQVVATLMAAGARSLEIRELDGLWGRMPPPVEGTDAHAASERAKAAIIRSSLEYKRLVSAASLRRDQLNTERQALLDVAMARGEADLAAKALADAQAAADAAAAAKAAADAELDAALDAAWASAKVKADAAQAGAAEALAALLAAVQVAEVKNQELEAAVAEELGENTRLKKEAAEAEAQAVQLAQEEEVRAAAEQAQLAAAQAVAQAAAQEQAAAQAAQALVDGRLAAYAKEYAAHRLAVEAAITDARTLLATVGQELFDVDDAAASADQLAAWLDVLTAAVADTWARAVAESLSEGRVRVLDTEVRMLLARARALVQNARDALSDERAMLEEARLALEAKLAAEEAARVAEQAALDALKQQQAKDLAAEQAALDALKQQQMDEMLAEQAELDAKNAAAAAALALQEAEAAAKHAAAVAALKAQEAALAEEQAELTRREAEARALEDQAQLDDLMSALDGARQREEQRLALRDAQDSADQAIAMAEWARVARDTDTALRMAQESARRRAASKAALDDTMRLMIELARLQQDTDTALLLAELARHALSTDHALALAEESALRRLASGTDHALHIAEWSRITQDTDHALALCELSRVQRDTDQALAMAEQSARDAETTRLAEEAERAAEEAAALDALAAEEAAKAAAEAAELAAEEAERAAEEAAALAAARELEEAERRQREQDERDAAEKRERAAALAARVPFRRPMSDDERYTKRRVEQNQRNVQLGELSRLLDLPNRPETRFTWLFTPDVPAAHAFAPLPAATAMLYPRPLLIRRAHAAHRGLWELVDASRPNEPLYGVQLQVGHCSRVHVLAANDPLVLYEPDVAQWLQMLEPVGPQDWELYYREELQPEVRLMVKESTQFREQWLVDITAQHGQDETRRRAALIGLRHHAPDGWVQAAAGGPGPLDFPPTLKQYVDRMGESITRQQWLEMFARSRLVGSDNGHLLLHRETPNGWLRVERYLHDDRRPGLYMPADGGDLVSAVEVVRFNPLERYTDPKRRGSRYVRELTKLRPERTPSMWSVRDAAVPMTTVFVRVDPASGRAVPNHFTLQSEAFAVDPPAAVRRWYAVPVGGETRRRDDETLYLQALAADIVHACDKRQEALWQPLQAAGSALTLESAHDLVPLMFGTERPAQDSQCTVALFAFDEVDSYPLRTLVGDGEPLPSKHVPLAVPLAEVLASDRSRVLFDRDASNDNDLDLEVVAGGDGTYEMAHIDAGLGGDEGRDPVQAKQRRLAFVCALVFVVEPPPPPKTSAPVPEAVPRELADELTRSGEIEYSARVFRTGTYATWIARTLQSRRNAARMLRSFARTRKNIRDALEALVKLTASELRHQVGLYRVLNTQDGVWVDPDTSEQLLIAPHTLEAVPLFEDARDEAALSTLYETRQWLETALLLEHHEGRPVPTIQPRVLERLRSLAAQERRAQPVATGADPAQVLPMGAARVGPLLDLCDHDGVTTAPRMPEAQWPVFYRDALASQAAQSENGAYDTWRQHTTRASLAEWWSAAPGAEAISADWARMPTWTAMWRALQSVRDPDLLSHAVQRRLLTEPAVAARVRELDQWMLALRSPQWAAQLGVKPVQELHRVYAELRALEPPPPALPAPLELRRWALRMLSLELSQFEQTATDVLESIRQQVDSELQKWSLELDAHRLRIKQRAVRIALRAERVRLLYELLEPLDATLKRRALDRLADHLAKSKRHYTPSERDELRRSAEEWAASDDLRSRLSSKKRTPALWPVGLPPTRQQLLGEVDRLAGISMPTIAGATAGGSGPAPPGAPNPSAPGVPVSIGAVSVAAGSDERPLPDGVQDEARAAINVQEPTATFAHLRDYLYDATNGAQLPGAVVLAALLAMDPVDWADGVDLDKMHQELARLLFRDHEPDSAIRAVGQLRVMRHVRAERLAELYRERMRVAQYYARSVGVPLDVTLYEWDPDTRYATDGVVRTELGRRDLLVALREEWWDALPSGQPLPRVHEVRRYLLQNTVRMHTALVPQWRVALDYARDLRVVLMAVADADTAARAAGLNQTLESVNAQQTHFFRPDPRETGVLSAALNSYVGSELDEQHRRSTALPMSVWHARIAELTQQAALEAPVSTGSRDPTSGAGVFSAQERRDLVMRSVRADDLAQCGVRMALRHFEEVGPVSVSVVPSALLGRLLWALLSDPVFWQARELYGLLSVGAAQDSPFRHLCVRWQLDRAAFDVDSAQDRNTRERGYTQVTMRYTDQVFDDLGVQYPGTVRDLQALVSERYPLQGLGRELWRLALFGREDQPDVFMGPHGHQLSLAHCAELAAFLVDLDAHVAAAIDRVDLMELPMDASTRRRVESDRQRVDRDSRQLEKDEQALDARIESGQLYQTDEIDRLRTDLATRQALNDRDRVRLDQELAAFGLDKRAKPAAKPAKREPGADKVREVEVSDAPAPTASSALRRVDRLALLHSVFVFLLGYMMPQHDPLDALFVERRHPDGHMLYDHIRGDIPLYVLREAHGLQMARRPMDRRYRHAMARLLSGQLYGPLAVRPTAYMRQLYGSLWAAQRRVLARYERVADPLSEDTDMISGTALCWGQFTDQVPAEDGRRANLSPLAGINTAPSEMYPEGVDGLYSPQSNNYAFEPQREHGFYEWRVGQQYYVRPALARDNSVATRVRVAAATMTHPVQDAALLSETDGPDWADQLELLPEGTPSALFCERLVMACEPGMERRALIDRVVAHVRDGRYLRTDYAEWAHQDVPPAADRVVQRDQQYQELRVLRTQALRSANAALQAACVRWFSEPCADLVAGDTATDRLEPPRAPDAHPEQHFVGARRYVEAAVRGAAAYQEYTGRMAERLSAELDDTRRALEATMGARRRAPALDRPAE